MAYGIPRSNSSLIAQEQRILSIPSDPKEKLLSQYITRLAQQNKVGTPEYFIAAGEFQNRQKIRQERAAKQGQPPPVAQQINQQAAEIAQEQGVAQLPVGGIGEIGNYTGATGGIVAFEDGGEVPRFQNRGLVRFEDLPIAPKNLRVSPGGFTYEASSFSLPDTTERRIDPVTGRPVTFGEYMRLLETRGMQQQQMPTVATVPTTTPAQVAQMTGQRFVGSDVQGSGADVRKSDIAAGGKDSPAMPSQVAPYIPKSMEMGNLTPAPVPVETVLQRANQIVKNSMGAAPSELTTKQGIANVQGALREAGFDPAFHQKQIADLRKEKEGIKGERQEAINLRLIEAGLGILGGESPYAFVNVGKGASPALKGLQEDFKDIKKIDRERDKAIRDLQTAEQDLKKSTGLAGLAEVQKSRERVDRYNELRTTKELSVFNTIYNGMVQERIAAMPTQDVRSAMAFKDRPDLLEIYKSMQASRYGGTNKISAAILQDYAKNPRKLEMLKDTDPDMYNYIKAELSAMSIPSAVNAPAGPVYK